MNYHLIIFYLILNIKRFVNGIGILNEVIPKEIKHGSLQNDYWSSGQSYEYYINITEYGLNEENIFEMYTKSDFYVFVYMRIYIILTNATIEEIINNKITPKASDLYIKNEKNYKLDITTGLNYFYMPYKKTSIDQKFLIIYINQIKDYAYNQEIFMSISNRIPKFYLNCTENNTKLFYGSLESRNDIHLYYKFELDKEIDLKINNIFFFVNDPTFPIFSTNLSSLITLENRLFIIKKNTNKISEIYVGLKNLESKYMNLSINLDKNDYYLLEGEKREDKKLLIENLNCENKFYIIEYYSDLYDKEMQKYLIINKLYGKYSLKYYKSFNNINFEDFSTEEEGIEINGIQSIEGKLNIYILNCSLPTAIIFELFSNNSVPINLQEGKQYTTFLNSTLNLDMKLSLFYEYKKYLFYISILDKDYINKTQQLNCNFKYRDTTMQFILDKENKNHNETIYLWKEHPLITVNSNEGAFIYYYLTSNRLFYNIVEGEMTLDKEEMENLIFKIRKDLLFDSITFEAEAENRMISVNYELKIINSKFIENNNKIMTSTPEINIPEANYIKLNVSNPYNKYDSIIADNDYDNYLYLLISFNDFIYTFPIYVNIKYNYNEEIIPISETKSEILLNEKDYEIYGDKNYLEKDKILFNINKCDSSKNYTFIHYYENYSIIMNKIHITENRNIILENNYYYNSKIKIIKEDNEETNIKSFVPSEYYNIGDIIFNYFSVKEELYNGLIITKDFSIQYEDKMRAEIIINWNKFIDNNYIDVNYSIFILPKNSIVNSMCQLSLIPSNKSVINTNKLEINLKEGKYKIAIIASVINKEFPITNMYDILFLNVSKRINIPLIIVLSTLGFIIIIIVLFIICRKKRKFICFKREQRTFSSTIEDNKINNNEMTCVSSNHNEEKIEKTKSEEITGLNENLIGNKKISIEEENDDNKQNK